jgi:NAD(P)-dependent dehydrogenase (short-subunit alcohol dehydrogenase family)
VRIVVIGGCGNFGARICRRLAGEPGLTLVATRRSESRGSEFMPVATAALDIQSPGFAAALKSLTPDLVIHCAGPFQGQDYRVALASVACGADYIDIADGREFVAGFVAAVGPAAAAAGCVAITGASTLPALSSAVVDALRPPFAVLTAIEIVIAPGQHAARGAATVAAVLSYAGRPFQWWREGAWRTAHGWQELERERFSFGRRLGAACDVPDLQLLPARYPGVRTVTFRAALEVSLQHYALWICAACRRMGLPLPLARWSVVFDRFATWLNWLGSDSGGMSVRLVGRDEAGQPLCRSWELVAKDNHGPEIPCMAAVILARHWRRGPVLAPGAKVCMGLLGLADFQPEFARWNIITRVDDCGAAQKQLS